MKRWIGRWIVGVGILHTLFGVIMGVSTLWAISHEGVWNSIDGHPGRPEVFWFLTSGFLIILLGALVDWLEGRGLTPPRFFGWSFLALLVVMIVLMPVSGVWLLVPPVLGLIRRAKA